MDIYVNVFKSCVFLKSTCTTILITLLISKVISNLKYHISHLVQFILNIQTTPTYSSNSQAMMLKVAYFFIVSSLSVFVSCITYEHISDCLFYDRGLVFGNDNITFICGEKNNEQRVIIDAEKFNCSNSLFLITNLWVGTVNFLNCRMPEVKTKFFKEFINIHTFNISNLELTRLQSDAFREAKNLTRLLVAKNHLMEIPPLLFYNTKKLIMADFSNNSINHVDPKAFVGATGLQTLDLSQNALNDLDSKLFKDLTKLKTLNLSYNQFSSIDASILPVSLLSLDLSGNHLRTLAEHSFDKLINLKYLDLSYNSVERIKSKTFGYLSNLEHLKMKQMKILDIQMGTFSQQYNLISLDLSENALHTLDFKLFSPIFSELKKLELTGNQLSSLNGFRNSLFPQLTSLDIRDNRFSCSYLIHFIETLNWEKIHLVVDQKPIDPNESNVRGIRCDDTNQNEDNVESAELISGGNCLNFDQRSNDDIKIIKVSLVLIFIVMLIYLVMFLVLNRDHISEHIHFPSTKSQSMTTINVDYSQEEI